MEAKYHQTIRQSATLILLLCTLGFEPLVAAQSPGEPRDASVEKYKVFIQRNPFGLKDPPAPPITKAPPLVSTYTTYLTGITGNPKLPVDAIDRLTAHFQRREPNKKSVEFSLKPGAAKDGIEVVAIDQIPNSKATRVRVIENGIEGIYTFAQNGIPQPRGTPPPNPGQPAQMPGMRVSMPSPQVLLPNPGNRGTVISPATSQATGPSPPTPPVVRTLNERPADRISIPQPPGVPAPAIPAPTVSVGSGTR